MEEIQGTLGSPPAGWGHLLDRTGGVSQGRSLLGQTCTGLLSSLVMACLQLPCAHSAHHDLL